MLRTCLDGHTKGKVAWYLSLMYGHGMIEEGDLDAFSERLRERCGRRRNASRRAGSRTQSAAGAEWGSAS